MRVLILLIMVFSLSNCTEEISSEKPPIEYLFFEQSRSYTMQRTYADVIRDGRKDYEIVEHRKTEYEGRKINIKKFSNAKTAEIDGEGELFFVDTLLVYERSVNWPNSYRVLQSNNDSINKLVGFSLAIIMGNPELFEPEPAKLMFEEYYKLKEKEK